MNMRTITVHNGKCHADEVFGVALINHFTGVKHEVVRTRDKDIISNTSMTLDVGGECDGFINIVNDEMFFEGGFDHHQFEDDNELYGLSSAGLVWRAIKTTLSLEDKYPTIDALVKDIDDQDIGVQPQERFHFTNIIGSFNHTDIYSIEQDMQFDKAVDFSMEIIKNFISKDEEAKAKADTLANGFVMALVRNTEVFRIMCIIPEDKSRPLPHISSIMVDPNEADFLLTYTADNDTWQMATVPLEKGSYKTKFHLLEMDDPNTVFVHKAGFLGVYKENGDGSIIVKCDDRTDSLIINPKRFLERRYEK